MATVLTYIIPKLIRSVGMILMFYLGIVAYRVLGAGQMKQDKPLRPAKSESRVVDVGGGV
jgi:hypothetical protein